LLFLMPGVAMVVAAGVDWLLRAPDADRRRVGWVLGGLLLTSAAGEAAARPAWDAHPHDVRSILPALQRHAQPNDYLVLSGRARPIVEYYLRRFPGPLRTALVAHQVELPGTCEWMLYLKRLHRLPPGARVWVLYVHHPAWYSNVDEKFVLEVLERMGRQRRERKAKGASLHLFLIGAGPEKARVEG
jgi:hypothetical protein